MQILPRAHTLNPTTTPIYPRFKGDEDINGELRASINRISARYGLQNRKAVRGASMLYLGLCVLKEFSERMEQEAAKKICGDILKKYQPGDSGNISFSTAYFSNGGKSGFDHMPYIENAAGIYMPNISNKKSYCFVFTVLGVLHHSFGVLPADDSWLDGYSF